METQENLEIIGIGTKEATKLEPATVKIVKAIVEPVGDKKAKKVSCEVKHPSANETIKISSVRAEKKGKLNVGGLWFNQDEDKNINARTVKELEGKECQTVEDDSGYLVFKAY